MLMPFYEPSFEPLAPFDHAAPFEARLAKLRRNPRRVLTARTTPFELVVGGLPQALDATDMGQGLHDLHPLDYSAWWFNLRANVRERLQAYAIRQPSFRRSLPKTRIRSTPRTSGLSRTIPQTLTE